MICPACNVSDPSVTETKDLLGCMCCGAPLMPDERDPQHLMRRVGEGDLLSLSEPHRLAIAYLQKEFARRQAQKLSKVGAG